MGKWLMGKIKTENKGFFFYIAMAALAFFATYFLLPSLQPIINLIGIPSEMAFILTTIIIYHFLTR